MAILTRQDGGFGFQVFGRQNHANLLKGRGTQVLYATISFGVQGIIRLVAKTSKTFFYALDTAFENNLLISHTCYATGNPINLMFVGCSRSTLGLEHC